MYKLKICRKKRNLRAADVSQQLNMTRANLYFFENSEYPRSSIRLKQFADLYNVSADYLIGRTEFMNFTDQYNYLQSLSGEELFRALDAMNITAWTTSHGDIYTKYNDAWWLTIKPERIKKAI